MSELFELLGRGGKQFQALDADDFLRLRFQLLGIGDRFSFRLGCCNDLADCAHFFLVLVRIAHEVEFEQAFCLIPAYVPNALTVFFGRWIPFGLFVQLDAIETLLLVERAIGVIL